MKLGLILMGRTMLSKSSIQFSVDGQGCVPSLLFDLRPNYGGIMKIMLTSFERACAHQDPGERSSDPQETNSDLLMNVPESPAEAWVCGGLPQGQGH